jgi:hypothetical protein
MTFKRLLNMKYSSHFIAVLLGVGLSTLFRKSCSSNECLEWKAPPLKKIQGRKYRHNDECYTYEPYSADCDDRRTVPF